MECLKNKVRRNNDKDDIIVSIVYCTYNHELYVEEALDSILCQKTNFKYEIIVHDDASKDNTQLILRKYYNENRELIVPIFQSENIWRKRTISMWTDVCFPLARGKYIAICDGDDFWTDNYKLQKQVDFLEQNSEYTFCFHNAIKMNFNSSCKSRLFNNLDEINHHTYVDLISRPWYIATSSLMFRNLDYDYPKWFATMENNDYALELLLASRGPFYYIPDIMSVYRILPNSDSKKSLMKLMQHLVRKSK